MEVEEKALKMESSLKVKLCLGLADTRKSVLSFLNASKKLIFLESAF